MSNEQNVSEFEITDAAELLDEMRDFSEETAAVDDEVVTLLQRLDYLPLKAAIEQIRDEQSNPRALH